MLPRFNLKLSGWAGLIRDMCYSSGQDSSGERTAVLCVMNILDNSKSYEINEATNGACGDYVMQSNISATAKCFYSGLDQLANQALN